MFLSGGLLHMLHLLVALEVGGLQASTAGQAVPGQSTAVGAQQMENGSAAVSNAGSAARLGANLAQCQQHRGACQRQ
jgi:hypothetical protein